MSVKGARQRTRDLQEVLAGGGFGEVVHRVSTRTDRHGYDAVAYRSVVHLTGPEHARPVSGWLLDHAGGVREIHHVSRDDSRASYDALVVLWGSGASTPSTPSAPSVRQENDA